MDNRNMSTRNLKKIDDIPERTYEEYKRYLDAFVLQNRRNAKNNIDLIYTKYISLECLIPFEAREYMYKEYIKTSKSYIYVFKFSTPLPRILIEKWQLRETTVKGIT